MKKTELKNECVKRGISQQDKVDELRHRLQVHMLGQLQSREVVLPPPEEGEFDWVVCQ